ncbi:hypothetical protein GCM10008910_26160 [Faecalicatena orotica]|uniref:AraC-like DNA-binding protein n=1 Tax=Faecalicatena orotica TaxID=1544 RepID=A0A2Y9BI74_9FIRM|nr:AraC family transcriptional regulator [Faecalicatena orotica]PWJ28143.1 AraC-like DNA-binding protein [Faecalicatena orotica]SSA56596.1 AraC-type DNA-binding protein [Faecalicatena orotica]
MITTKEKNPFGTIEFTDTYKLKALPSTWCIALAEQGSGSYLHQNLISDFQHRDCFLLYDTEDITLSYGEGKPCRFTLFSFSMDDVDTSGAADKSQQLLKQFFSGRVTFQHFSLPRKNYDAIRALLKLCNQILQDTLPVSPMIYRHTFLALILYFAQTGFVLKPESQLFTKSFSTREVMIAQVKHLIRQNYADPLPLSYLAAYVYANPSYLSRIFKADTGMCLSAFINQVRIDNAKQLLEDTDELIIDIAISCGFNQIPHFNRIFKEYTGMSPSAYRKAYRHRAL